MIKVHVFIIACALFFGENILAQQGPYAPQAGTLGSTAIHKDSSIIIDWAVTALVKRGWQDIADTSLGKVNVGMANNATGVAGVNGNGVVSLGDKGEAILTFNGLITNGPGPDFVVFENGFSGFLELAVVEVSSDGVNFFRFLPHSLTDTNIQIGSFGAVDPTNINNLAGKYIAQYGTPFDLSELTNTSGLDINAISHVKIIDVVGTILSDYATYDKVGRAINDPYPTVFGSGGFDLDAVGVMYLSPMSISDDDLSENIKFYPNPVKDFLIIKSNTDQLKKMLITDISGKEIYTTNFIETEKINTTSWEKGLFIISITANDGVNTIEKIIKM